MPIKEYEPEIEETFVISSGEFSTLEDAANQVAKWQRSGKLSRTAKVYKVRRSYPIVNGVITIPSEE